MSVPGPGFSYDRRRKVARFCLYVPGSGGRNRRIKTVYVDDRSQAEALYRQFRLEVESERSLPTAASPDTSATPATAQAAPPEPASPTVRAFVDEHLTAHLKARKCRPNTVGYYWQVIKTWILPRFGDRMLGSFKKRDVDDFVVVLREAGKSETTCRAYAQVLLRLLRLAVDRDVIEVYPIHKCVELPRAAKPTLELSPAETVSLLAAFDDRDGFVAYLSAKRPKWAEWCPDQVADYFARFRSLKPMVVTALNTGLRRGDLLALRWSSIDLVSGWITVEMRKTGKPVSVPISRACRAALEECAERRHPGVEEVFLAPSGEPIRREQVQDYFSIAKAVAGITRRLRFHDLRHTFATNLSSSHVELQVISAALGHSSIEMTQRYARTRRAALEPIRDALDRLAAEDATQAPASTRTHEQALTN